MEENSQVNSGRIDLSRFSAMTEGKWEIIDTPTGGIDVGVRHGAYGHSPVISFTQRLADMVRKSPRDMADLNAIAMLPELIKALAKMYKREDELLDALQVIKEDLETGIAQGNIPINATTGIDLTKIRNFANDAGLS